jgi:antitoxin CptB
MKEDLVQRRKRLLFRSHHRGTKELDLIIGSFAERYLRKFDHPQLDRFEALLDIPEPFIYDWLVGRGSPPTELRHDVMELLLAFEYPHPNRS